MDLIEHWRGEQKKLKDRTRELTDGADAEGRGLNDDERGEVKKSLEQIAEFEQKVTAEEEKRNITKILGDFEKGYAEGTYRAGGVPRDVQAVVRAKSMGEAFVESEGYQALSLRVKGGQRPPQDFKIEMNLDPSVLRIKAAGDPVVETDSTDIFGTGGAAGALTTFVPPVFPLQPDLRVGDLIPSVPVTVGNSASWLEVETRTPFDSAAVTEGSTKPGGEYVFKVASAEIASDLSQCGTVGNSASWLEVETRTPFELRGGHGGCPRSQAVSTSSRSQVRPCRRSPVGSRSASSTWRTRRPWWPTSTRTCRTRSGSTRTPT